MALAAFVAAFTEEPLMTSNNVTGDLTGSATGSVTGGRKLAAMNLADESVRPCARIWSGRRLAHPARLAQCAVPQLTDTGKFWVLRETNARGFWELMAPLVPNN